MKTLLLGMGNPIFGDDAIGFHSTANLVRQLRDVPGLDIVQEYTVGGLDLLDVLAGYVIHMCIMNA